MILHRLTLGDMTVNCYVAADETTKNAALFDAPAEPEKILDYIDKNGLKLSYIFLTHAHFDHIGALEVLLRETCAKLVLHRDEVKYLNDSSLNLADLAGLSFPKFCADIIISHGDVLNIDDIAVEVIHTPGHTQGSVCYLMGDILISGDTLFNHSVGRSDFPLSSYNDEIKYINERLMVLEDNVVVYPGHGFSTTIGCERRENPYLI